MFYYSENVVRLYKGNFEKYKGNYRSGQFSTFYTLNTLSVGISIENKFKQSLKELSSRLLKIFIPGNSGITVISIPVLCTAV